MSLVSRIERVQTHNIKVVGGRRLLQYRGSSLPLVRLEDHVKTTADGRGRTLLRHRLPRRRPRNRPARRRSSTTSANWRSTSTRTTFRERGIAGAFVLNETTMRLVDTVELAQVAHPEWFEQVAAPTLDDDESAPTILIAEDSSFFRKQLIKFFEEKGFHVVDLRGRCSSPGNT